MQYVNTKKWLDFYRSQTTRHAIKTAIATVLSIVVYRYFHFPWGYWATITTLIVMQSNIDTGSFEMTLKVAWQRLVGTVAGAVVSLIIIFLIPYNYWQLLVMIFIIIIGFTYINRYYEGFKLAGVTAIIILLLSDHESIAQSYALIRVTEILLGVMIAVCVTILIWPYRITDHLQERRVVRLLSVYTIFMDLQSRRKIEHHAEIDALVKEVQSDLEKVKVAKKEVRDKSQSLLLVEEKFLKALNRLSQSFIKLPEAYWEFTNLQDITLSLIGDIAVAVKALTSQKESQEQYARIRQETERYEKAFDGFRSYRRQAGIEPFSIDDSYQVINSYNALQRCSERICDFGEILRPG